MKIEVTELNNHVKSLNRSLVKILNRLESPETDGEFAWRTAIVLAQDLAHALRMSEPRVCKLCKCIKPHSEMPEVQIQIRNMKQEWNDLCNAAYMTGSDICSECLTKLVMP